MIDISIPINLTDLLIRLCIPVGLFDEIPTVFQRLITLRASGRAATQLLSNPNVTQLLSYRKHKHVQHVCEYECNQGWIIHSLVHLLEQPTDPTNLIEHLYDDISITTVTYFIQGINAQPDELKKAWSS